MLYRTEDTVKMFPHFIHRDQFVPHLLNQKPFTVRFVFNEPGIGLIKIFSSFTFQLVLQESNVRINASIPIIFATFRRLRKNIVFDQLLDPALGDMKPPGKFFTRTNNRPIIFCIFCTNK